MGHTVLRAGMRGVSCAMESGTNWRPQTSLVSVSGEAGRTRDRRNTPKDENTRTDEPLSAHRGKDGGGKASYRLDAPERSVSTVLAPTLRCAHCL